MRLSKYQVLIALALGIVATAEATPINIQSVKVVPLVPSATTQEEFATKVFTIYNLSNIKLQGVPFPLPLPPGGLTAAAVAVLKDLLVSASTNQTPPLPVPITPCSINGDQGITGVFFSCEDDGQPSVSGGRGAEIRFETNALFSYDLDSALPKIVDPKLLDSTFNKAFQELPAANFLSPAFATPGDTTGRVVRIHFNQRIAQFGFLVDPGPQLNSINSVGGIQFIVNDQTTPVQRTPVGSLTFVGVQDSAGFTDVTVIPSGANQAWVADQFTYLPLANF
jgi:hypothetical protein